MAEERVQRRLAAIFSADVVGYSRLMAQDEAGSRLLYDCGSSDANRLSISIVELVDAR